MYKNLENNLSYNRRRNGCNCPINRGYKFVFNTMSSQEYKFFWVL